jgi:hypothetical protein
MVVVRKGRYGTVCCGEKKGPERIFLVWLLRFRLLCCLSAAVGGAVYCSKKELVRKRRTASSSSALCARLIDEGTTKRERRLTAWSYRLLTGFVVDVSRLGGSKCWVSGSPRLLVLLLDSILWAASRHQLVRAHKDKKQERSRATQENQSIFF